MAPIGRPFITRAVRAARDSGSLRVTVPQVVAATLGLHAGDDVGWVVDPTSGHVWIERVARSATPAAPSDPLNPESSRPDP